MNFHHVGISVTNIDRSIAFYRDMLGMTLAMEPFALSGEMLDMVNGLKGVQVRTCHMMAGGASLELFEYASPDSKPKDPSYSVADRGISHFGVMVTDIEGIYDRCTAAGVIFHCPVQTFPGGMMATYGRDPDGNVFELLERSVPQAEGSKGH